MTSKRRSILSPAELRTHRLALCAWRPPIEFSAQVSSIVADVISEQFFTDPHAGFLRDAWVAARFGLATQPESIRLDLEWPDFQCRVGRGIHDYELTEADEPGRRRGAEYKSGLHNGWRHDPVEDWVRRADAAPEAIRKSVERKSARGYPPTTRLVVYLNIGEYGIRQKQIEGCLAAVTVSGKSSFEEIWVLWKERLYLVWERGRAGEKILGIPPVEEAA